jgi:hypothetical protein
MLLQCFYKHPIFLQTCYNIYRKVAASYKHIQTFILISWKYLFTVDLMLVIEKIYASIGREPEYEEH